MWTCGFYLIRVEHGILSADVLEDGTCLTIIEEVEVVVEEVKKKKKVEEVEILDPCLDAPSSPLVSAAVCPS